ncbi:TAXI family TRAP transporter solute-binding subunit [Corynebacterium propinquum]|uniref:TAXI family TRAP transporter solute-binding subunit n=1 Tax=Corynebacterium TaxID=1716 RepID=UPI00036CA1E8|nr:MULTISPECIES: TAXI family TRAP transporter solute-binding subunit [Corynebacterium]MCG7231842.1 TAXI family TRAP transporter solute-binding subunit [Corynebacterium propinquum]MDK4206888.1 TAXI family TRAP transporter solute-binding subunit [Corynebacterium pseudodiphtheriticum]QQU91603.1 TAXI family TRAP transporter solute-binding subunit [Corynebacterium propinquum]WKS44414.1 TAXI family TRAP transporter solute-binding subunit [Corynebacterium propinquum]
MRRSTKIISKVWIILLAGIVASCSSTSGNASDNHDKATLQDWDFITVASGGTSGNYYQIGSTMETILGDELEVGTSVQPSTGSIENIELLRQRRAEIAFVMGDAVYQAQKGIGPYAGKTDTPELAAITAMYPNWLHLVTLEGSGIKTVDDLHGKRVGVGSPNSGVEANAKILLNAFGLTYDDFDVDFLSYSDSADQLQNGQIDAAFTSSGIPNSAIMDLSTQQDVRIVPIEGAGLDNLLSEYPIINTGEIPAGTYDNTEDVPVIAMMNQLVVRKDAAEEDVYLATKALFENLDELHASAKAAQQITFDSVEDGLVLDLHPGARRYFEEVGAL